MPVFLFTIHAYRSWSPDNPRGFVRRGEGTLAPDSGLARAYNQQATHSRVVFSAKEQAILAAITAEACSRRGWRLHGVATEPTHAHLLISWEDETRSVAVCGKLKNLISRELNRHSTRKRKWLSRGASKKRVVERNHFEHLLCVYLPKHRGLVWIEGRDPPLGFDPSAAADG